jgi:hypothetical protein
LIAAARRNQVHVESVGFVFAIAASSAVRPFLPLAFLSALRCVVVLLCLHGFENFRLRWGRALPCVPLCPGVPRGARSCAPSYSRTSAEARICYNPEYLDPKHYRKVQTEHVHLTHSFVRSRATFGCRERAKIKTAPRGQAIG